MLCSFSSKVLILVWFVNLTSSRGAQKTHRAVPNEALYGVLRISRRITWTYLHSFWNSLTVMHGTWLTQEPPCRFQTICFLFPRSHGFRNLNFCRLRQMEQLLLAEAKQGLLSDISQIVSSIPSYQVQLKCFCTFDAFHISNSIRCFWESVWFMLDSSRWHEPLGESLSRLKIDTLKWRLNWRFWISNSSK